MYDKRVETCVQSSLELASLLISLPFPVRAIADGIINEVFSFSVLGAMWPAERDSVRLA